MTGQKEDLWVFFSPTPVMVVNNTHFTHSLQKKKKKTLKIWLLVHWEWGTAEWMETNHSDEDTSSLFWKRLIGSSSQLMKSAEPVSCGLITSTLRTPLITFSVYGYGLRCKKGDGCGGSDRLLTKRWKHNKALDSFLKGWFREQTFEKNTNLTIHESFARHCNVPLRIC